jgi:hypothetical protein
MKNYSMLIILSLAAISIAFAQNAPSGKTLAATMDVQVFPKVGQQADQQSMDEASCYEWAASNTRSDPFELQRESVAEAQQTEQAKAEAQQIGQGAGLKGAAGGAVAGAVVGEVVSNDAGKGAAIGATAGAIRGRRKARAAKKQATAQAEQQGAEKQQAIEGQINNFKKAFSVCLEAKDYLVKY